jgi:hypothetical protein
LPRLQQTGTKAPFDIKRLSGALINQKGGAPPPKKAAPGRGTGRGGNEKKEGRKTFKAKNSPFAFNMQPAREDGL